MVGLPRAIIKKYGVTKKAWEVFRGARATTPTTKVIRVNRHRVSPLIDMARRKSKPSHTRRLGRRFRRHIGKAKMPFEVLIAGASVPFTPAADGWDSPFGYMQAGNIDGVMNSLKIGFLGLDTNGKLDIMRTLNPFDLDYGRYSKMLMMAGIVGTVRRKISGRYTNKLFSKIPLIGKWVS